MHIRKSAFSLLEMMVVIAIIGGLAGVMVVGFMQKQEHAAVETTRATIKQVEGVLKMYYLQHKKYPSTDDGLSILVTSGDLTTTARDAWGLPLNYELGSADGKPFTIWSTGRDGVDGGEGPDADIYNREEETE